MSQPLWSAIQTILLYVLIIYGVFVLGFYVLSDGIIFQPPKADYQDNGQIIKIPIDNTKKISALYFSNPKATITILYSHGNAEDLGTLVPILIQFRDQGYNILAYDYQGYGTSNGKPSEKNTYQDILAAYHYLTNTLNTSPDNIVVYGRSLGTGPSVYLASKVPVKGLILVSPFVSAYRVQIKFPIIPFDKYPNLKTISTLTVPLLVIHGTQDTLIPLWHGKKIANNAKGPTQTLWIKGANHNDPIQQSKRYWQAINHFIHELQPNKQNGP